MIKTTRSRCLGRQEASSPTPGSIGIIPPRHRPVSTNARSTTLVATSSAVALASVGVFPAAFVRVVPDRSCHIDFMAYTRGPQDDYDKYASLVGDSGWSWSSLQQYWKRVCRSRAVPLRTKADFYIPDSSRSLLRRRISMTRRDRSTHPSTAPTARCRSPSAGTRFPRTVRSSRRRSSCRPSSPSTRT